MPARRLLVLPLLACLTAILPAAAQAPGQPRIETRDRNALTQCLRDNAGAASACIGSVAIACVRAAPGDRAEAEIGCARREEALWRERMTMALRVVSRGLDVSGASRLAALQSGWEAHAQQSCAFEAGLQAPARSGGRLAGCNLREVALRALAVERLGAGRRSGREATPPRIIR